MSVLQTDRGSNVSVAVAVFEPDSLDSGALAGRMFTDPLGLWPLVPPGAILHFIQPVSVRVFRDVDVSDRSDDCVTIVDSTNLDWLADPGGFIIDMDGVLYKGSEAIPDAKPFLAALNQQNIPFVMATNNATQTPDEYVRKLDGMGIEIRADQVFTSAMATATYLRERFPAGSSAYVIGTSALRDAIFADGYFDAAEIDADIVVSSADFNLVYETLRVACLAIRNGAEYVATNADTTFPTPEGLVPGAGSIVAALVASGGKEPTVVGKPSPVLVERALAAMGTSAADTVMLGDRLDTDILAGQRAGTRTCLVTTGISTVDDVETSGIRPDLVVGSLDELRQAIQAGTG